MNMKKKLGFGFLGNSRYVVQLSRLFLFHKKRHYDSLSAWPFLSFLSEE